MRSKLSRFILEFPSRRFIFASLIGLAILLSTACSKQRTDAEIIGDVVTRLQANPQLAGRHFAVMSNKGVVTLHGTATREAERTMVSSIAAQVEGVRTVVNDVVVAAPVPAAQPAVEDPMANPEPLQEPQVAQSRNKDSAARPKQRAESAKIASAASSSPSRQSSIPLVFGLSSPPASSSTATGPILPAAPAPAPIQLIRLDSGTQLSIRLIDSIDSAVNHPGDTFRATLDAPVMAGDEVALPEGANVVGKIVESKEAGRFTGRSEMALELTSVSVGNRRYMLHTNQHTLQGGSQGARTAKTVGGGAALGALIGAIAGGGKGAAIGAAVGAGAGGGVQAARKPQQVRLGSEARLSFRLDSPISVAPVASLERGNTNDISGAATANQPVKVYSSEDSDGERPVLKRRPPPTAEPE